jgi:hypothetical protein
VPDGKVCLNEQGELAVTKFAVEPVTHCHTLFPRHCQLIISKYRFGTSQVLLRDSESVLLPSKHHPAPCTLLTLAR